MHGMNSETAIQRARIRRRKNREHRARETIGSLRTPSPGRAHALSADPSWHSATAAAAPLLVQGGKGSTARKGPRTSGPQRKRDALPPAASDSAAKTPGARGAQLTPPHAGHGAADTAVPKRGAAPRMAQNLPPAAQGLQHRSPFRAAGTSLVCIRNASLELRRLSTLCPGNHLLARGELLPHKQWLKSTENKLQLWLLSFVQSHRTGTPSQLPVLLAALALSALCPPKQLCSQGPRSSEDCLP